MPISRSQLQLFPWTGGLSDLHPDEATFGRAKDLPVHGWYAYLEGFSPGFVKAVLSQYAPTARRILEPFAGTGTGVLAAMELGIEAFYCEINPALRFVTSVKQSVTTLPTRSRRLLARKVGQLAGDLPRLLRRHPTDPALADDYLQAFGESTYFTPAALRDILRLRSLADELADNKPLLASLLELAVVAEIVNVSLLRRAGDVRFRTPRELARGISEPKQAIRSRLWAFAGDILAAPVSVAGAHLAVPDAKNLHEVAPLNCDAVVTSPPYLNGTNYARNTRLELWFLRSLGGRDGIRLLRDSMVTSGINDVSRSTVATTGVAAIDEVISELERSSYDRRIARMVAGYFSDMKRVFAGLARHLTPDGIACVDIGDSRYGGIHVPTGDFLGLIAEDVGFEVSTRQTLRRRQSRDGSSLIQELVVFRRARAQALPSRPSVDIHWEDFKRVLPHRVAPYSKRNWGHANHSLCSYAGKLKPSLAHHLIRVFTSKGDTVVDPFAGSGTIPFEAALGGRRAIGLDISELASCLTRAKIDPPTLEDALACAHEVSSFAEHFVPTGAMIDDSNLVAFNKSLSDYYHTKTFREILGARQYFLNRSSLSVAQNYVLACLLHLLHGNRPYALSRRSHPITPYAPTGPREYRDLRSRLAAKVQRGLSEPLGESFVRGQVFKCDATLPWPVQAGSIDAVITSPPFVSSTKFYLANWIRSWFCGWSRSDFDTAPAAFVERRQARSRSVYREVLAAAWTALRPAGVLILHLGLSRKVDMASELAQLAGDDFSVKDRFDESVTHCESHGIRDKGGTSHHQYLVLEKR